MSVIDDYYINEDDILYHIYTPQGKRIGSPKGQIVIPDGLRWEILTLAHDDPISGGHFGVFKTYEKIKLRYYWQGLFSDIRHWCLSCVHCLMKKNPSTKSQGPMLPLPVEGPFDRVDCCRLRGTSPKNNTRRSLYCCFFRLPYSLGGSIRRPHDRCYSNS